MKAIWNGWISFGLVSIPIKLYSAIEEHALGFKMLCKKCNTPLHFKRWCNHCKKDVEWSDVVKGIELEKGKYFVLSQEVLKKLRPAKTNRVDIVEFIETPQIDPIYFDKHYYVAPGSTEKAYALFYDALKQTGKAAIGTFIMREKEYVCAIQSYDIGLLLTTLNYGYEIRAMKKIEEFAHKQPKIDAKELRLAKQLIEQLSVKKFDISEFKDTYAHQLKELIKKKRKGKVVKVKEEQATKKTTSKHHKQPSLMESLHESLQVARG